MNLAEVKLNNKRNKLMNKAKSTSDPYKSQADNDYDAKKLAEHNAIHSEIKRISLTDSFI